MILHNRLLEREKGFTLLEIIVVIIIIGVLASLALPRLFNAIQFSYSAEAFAHFASMRRAMERCYLMNNGSYAACSIAGGDFEAGAGTHFQYASITYSPEEKYVLIACRYSNDGGVANSNIQMQVDVANKTVLTCGTGTFERLGQPCFFGPITCNP